jgi:hypothetical protein
MRNFVKTAVRSKAWKVLVFAGTLVAFAAAPALPAGATTPASFTLTAGALSISAPTGSVSLGSQVASNSSSTFSGQLGDVTVSDQRGGARPAGRRP